MFPVLFHLVLHSCNNIGPETLNPINHFLFHILVHLILRCCGTLPKSCMIPIYPYIALCNSINVLGPYSPAVNPKP